MEAAELITVLMRWAHIASVVVLIGGFAYARWIAAPALQQLEEKQRLAAFDWLTRRFRPLVYGAGGGVLISGLYNLLSHHGHTRYYHIWFGFKFLLALHVFAAAILSVKTAPETEEVEAKRRRRMTGVLYSGLLIILISAYLRRIY